MRLSLKKYNYLPEFNMLALLDVIFIIVIFCIIGMTRMVFLEMIDVENPKLQVSKHAKPKDFVTITVRKDGKLFFNKEPVSSQREITKRLLDKKDPTNDVTVIINGEEGAMLGDALRLLQTVREADVSKVYFKVKGVE